MTNRKPLLASIMLILLLSIVALGVTACSNNNYNIALNQTYLELEVGGEAKLTAEVTRYAGKNKPVWSSTRVEIATVSDDGVVTAVSAGAATIKATLEDKTTCCTVVVKEAAPETVEVTSITLDKTVFDSVTVGERIQLFATVEPSNATDKTVTWQSMDNSIATVNSSGLVTVVGKGVTVIAAIAGDKIAVCQVTGCSPTVEVSNVNLNDYFVNMCVNDSFTLVATVTPSNATDQTVIWQSLDTLVATVSNNGVVTAVGSGVTVITATVGNRLATCTVTVEQSNPTVDNEFRFTYLTVTNGNSVSGNVRNATETFSFADEIIAGKDVSYTVCADVEGRDVIPSKVVSLSTGDNKFYVLANFSDNSSKLYKVTIHRNCMFTISFDTDGGGEIEPIVEEEGIYINLPIPSKMAYTFMGWTLDGELVDHEHFHVTNDVELLARFEPTKYSVTLSSEGLDAQLSGGGAYEYGGHVEVSAEKRLGYDFLGWYNGDRLYTNNYIYRFTMPIIPVKLTAKYKVSDDVANLDFESTADTFVIKGFKEGADTSNLLIPTYTTDIEEDAFSSYDNDLVIENVYWRANNLPSEGKPLFVWTKIHNLYFDNSVTYFPSDTFGDNEGVENLYYQGTMSDWLNMDFVDDTPLLGLSVNTNWFVNGELVTEVVVPNDITVIKNFVFSGARITSVILHEGITEIGYGAFRYCTALESISLPSSLTSIGAHAFAVCSKLTGQLVIPEGVTELGNLAFFETRFTSAVIPASVNTLGNNVFDGVKTENETIKEIYFGGTLEQWEQISVGEPNWVIDRAKLYYYSGTEPELNDEGTDYDGFFWHYVDGEIVVWTKDDNE